MGQKNLAGEYALARLRGKLGREEVTFCEHFIFTEADIKDAFNAGRESVVENIPKLIKDDSTLCIYDVNYWIKIPKSPDE